MGENYRLTKKRKILTLEDYVDERVQNKRSLGKYSTADLYQAAGYHFRNFYGKEDCRLSDLNPTLVADFVHYLQSLRLKTNTINSYLSSLRAIFNAALQSRIVRVKEHPFSGLKLKREMTAKRAVSVEFVKKMAAMDFTEDPRLDLAADLSLFSFMAYGMPFIDIVHLKKVNIDGDEIIYNRHKTGVQISIKITIDVLVKLTSYVMRYTWASEALRCNIPITVISQAMGHTSEKTTRIYLEQLDASVLNKANKQITGILDVFFQKSE